jgi:ParB-like chromosome segregation protein Spo0J
MLSGEYESVPIASIWVDRSNRIRREVTEAAVAEKMESISRIGLIHPLVITREGKLVSGETRLTALQRLGHTSVSVQWSDTLDERELTSRSNLRRTSSGRT